MKKLEYELLRRLYDKYGYVIKEPDVLDETNTPLFSDNKLLLTYKKCIGHKQTKAIGIEDTKITNTCNLTIDENLDERMRLIQIVSGDNKVFKENFQTILQIHKKLSAVCAREVKKATSKTSKVNPVLKSKKLNKELATYDKKIRRSQGVTTRADAKQEKAEKRKLEEIEEEKRQKLKFSYLLNQTEAFANYFLNRSNNTEDVKGIKAAKRQLESTRKFDEDVKKQKLSAVEDPEPTDVYVHKNIEQPKMLKTKLKEYQLKGLNWLVSLYNQGINGILADDMGLGKTVQTISFLGHLYEEQHIEKTFLVIAPTSTLHNWSQEFEKFLPDFEICEYWGTVNERKDARKTFKTANVIITSYQLALLDKSFLRKIKFHYMVLDEAQAIKNNSSQRWNALLQFKARNRLLLTGTPIQNTMAELWALLHFIMPTLFDSVAEFSEWFSKEIEGKKGEKKIDTEQINKLHTILKPFMLRRHKDDIKDELGKKKMVMIECDLSLRQKILYDEIKQSKMDYENTVMQLKKVCNHPDLFEKLESHTNLTNNLQINNFVQTFNNNFNLIEFRSDKKEVVHEKFYSIDRENLEDKNAFLKRVQGKEHKNELFKQKLVQYKFQIERNEISEDIKRKKLFENMLKRRFVFRTKKVCMENNTSIVELDKENVNISQTEHITQKIDSSELIKLHPLNTFINDSGKLKTLSCLLEKLKKEGHKILVYFQMTKMMDLFEEFMVKKQHNYLRLDGTTKIKERRTIVNAWQDDPNYFVFILSTRAGGVGINLTAADTVIFYDNDWNPTVDQQAMDRVHRLGQTKDVTVYRMITRNTVEERIMEAAGKKGEMQKLVIKEDVFKGE